MASIRPLTHADIPAAQRLRQQAGWNQSDDDWRRLLAWDPAGCWVAVSDHGRVVGTTAVTSYGQRIAWVGMVLVDVEHRRQGIGRALLTHALAYLEQRGVQTVALDSTPEGQPLYASLGFVDAFELERWRGPLPANLPPGGRHEPRPYDGEAEETRGKATRAPATTASPAAHTPDDVDPVRAQFIAPPGPPAPSGPPGPSGTVAPSESVVRPLAAADALPLSTAVGSDVGAADVRAAQRVGAADVRAAQRPGGGASSLRLLAAADLPALTAYDARLFGTERGHILAALQAGHPAGCVLAERDGSIVGYVLSRPGARAWHLGPLAADDPVTAERLAQAALQPATTLPELVLDVVRPNAHAISLAQTLGLAPVRRFIRMTRGAPPPAIDASRLYTSAGPELG
jgi:predicted N-acetyltransferase YhbS